jgi:hypothetical protein
MRMLHLGILAVAAAGIVTLVGCESMTPMGPSMVEKHMGEAVKTNVAKQTENPNAAYDNTGSPEIDADTAAVVVDVYFQKQSQANEPQQMPSIIQIDAN